MESDPTRRDELIGAAVAGELTAAEQDEFDRAAERDPSMLVDLAEVREVAARLSAADLHWREEVPPPVVLPGSADELAGRRAARDRPAGPTRNHVRPWVAGVAAGLVLIGAAGGVGIRALTELPPSGPPGTLGAVEPVVFTAVPAQTTITGSLVAHTWGTETVLEVDGLPVGETYDVVLVDRDQHLVESGAFLGAGATVTCRMNAAVLRQDVSALQIRDDRGRVVATGAVPTVR